MSQPVAPQFPPRLIALTPVDVSNKVIYRRDIWWPARALDRVVGSRRLWLSYALEVDLCGATITFADGRPLKLRPSAAVFTDPDNKWMDDFRAADASGLYPLRHCDRTEKPIYIHLIIQYAAWKGFLPEPPPLPTGNDRWP